MSAPTLVRTAVHGSIGNAATAVVEAFTKRSDRYLAKDLTFGRMLSAVKVIIFTAKLSRGLSRVSLSTENSSIERSNILGPLDNVRHETFAEIVAAGRSASLAYATAYGRSCDASSRVNGARLLANANIRARVTEIRCSTLAKSSCLLQTIVDELGRSAVKRIREGTFKEACSVSEHFTETIINLMDLAEGIDSRSVQRRQ